jgi:hypothetical protein
VASQPHAVCHVGDHDAVPPARVPVLPGV